MDKIVRRMVLESLGLEKYIDEHFNSTDYLFRFQKYDPPRTPHSTLALRDHIDKNFITTIHEFSHVKGLQILTKDGKTWIPGDTTSLDSFVVLVATCLQVCYYYPRLQKIILFFHFLTTYSKHLFPSSSTAETIFS